VSWHRCAKILVNTYKNPSDENTRRFIKVMYKVRKLDHVSGGVGGGGGGGGGGGE